MKWLLVFLMLQSTAALAAAPVSTDLSIAVSTEFETLHPALNSMIASIYVQDATARPLVALDRDGNLKSFLLKSVPTFENKMARLIAKGASKKLEVQLEIIQEAQWGDGKPLTCQDIEAAWQIGRHESVSVPNRQEYLNIEEVRIQADNPKKCVVFFTEAKIDFQLRLPRPVPAHLEMPIFNAQKSTSQGYEKNTLYIKDVTNPGLYNGPYRVSELKIGSHVILVPNSKFLGKAPFFKKIILKFITNTSAMEAQLLAKNVDMLSSSAFGFDQALAFEKRIQKEKLPYRVILQPGVLYSHLDYNLDHPALKDVKVRQALSYALNRQELVKAFFENRQPMALHFSTPFDVWYTEEAKFVKKYEFDPKKASALLEEAGWKKGADGIRVKDGKRLTLTISSAVDIKLNEMIQIFIQSAWKKIGVEVLVRNYPLRVLIAEIMKKRKFEVGLGTWGLSRNGSQMTMLHSSMIPNEQNNWSGNNRPGWQNKEVDQLLESAESEMDLKKKSVLMKKIIKIYTEELPAMPLYYRSSNSVVPVGLKNYRVSPDTSTEYLDVENWSW